MGVKCLPEEHVVGNRGEIERGNQIGNYILRGEGNRNVTREKSETENF